MKINNLLAGYADPTNLGKRAESLENKAAAAVKPAAAVAAAATGSTAARDILVQYDVTHMTPTQFSQMSQKLCDAGAISQQDYQDLTKIRGDLDAAGVDPNEATNLLQFYQDKIQNASQAAATNPAQAAQISPLAHRLDWLEKFSMVQTHPESVGLSALA